MELIINNLEDRLFEELYKSNESIMIISPLLAYLQQKKLEKNYKMKI